MNRILPATFVAALASVSLPIGSAMAETFTVTNITSPAGEDLVVTVPTLEAVDTNLTEAQIRALFSGDIAGIAENLASLDAASITIPELTITFEVPSGEDGSETTETGKFVYEDIVINDVKSGVAGSSSIGSGELVGTDDVTFTIGKLSTGTFDITALLGFYGLVEPSDTDTMRTVYSDFSFEGASIQAADFSCEIGSVTLDEFRARPLKTSFAEMMAVIEKLEALDEDEMPPPETMRTFVDFYADMLTAFESSPMEFSGLDCSGTDDEGNEVAISSGPLNIDGFESGIYPAVSMNDLHIAVDEDGVMDLGNFTVKSTDLNPLLDVLRAAPDPLDESWFEANFRKLIPPFEGFSLSNFSMDIPDEAVPGERIKASLGAFDLTLEDYLNGIPTSITSNATDLAVVVPPSASAEMGFDLAALGFEELNMGYDLAIHWDEAEDVILVEKLGITADRLGSVNVAATLGNATEELFGEDVDTATMAAMGLVVKDITIDVVDDGLRAIALAQAAAAEGADVEAYRTQISGVAQGTALALLGGTADAQSVAQALGAFIDGAPKLTLTLTAKDPAGIGLAEFMTLQDDPTQLVQVMTITAEASGQ